MVLLRWAARSDVDLPSTQKILWTVGAMLVKPEPRTSRLHGARLRCRRHRALGQRNSFRRGRSSLPVHLARGLRYTNVLERLQLALRGHIPPNTRERFLRSSPPTWGFWSQP